MNSFLQVINFLLAMAGFGVAPNPNAPTADAALTYALPDADIVVHLDALSVVPNNFKVLKALPDMPEIKASPELRTAARQIVTDIDGGRALIKGMVGIDLATDVNDVTAFVQLGAVVDRPNVLAAIHGKFNLASIASIAKMAQKQTTAGGAMVEIDSRVAVALTKSGVLLVGTPALVTPRLADTWKATPRAGNTLLSQAADVIDSKPFAAVMVSIAPAKRKELTKMAGDNFVSDVINRHKFMAFGLHADGVSWVWADATRAGADRMAMMSEGLIEVMRATQVAPRGVGKILLGALESYRGTSKEIDQIIAAKGKIAAAIAAYTGDGQFKVNQVVDPKNFRVTVRATGKSLSEVLPIALMGPAIGAGLWTATVKTTQPTPMLQPTPAPQPIKPTPAKRK